MILRMRMGGGLFRIVGLLSRLLPETSEGGGSLRARMRSLLCQRSPGYLKQLRGTSPWRVEEMRKNSVVRFLNIL